MHHASQTEPEGLVVIAIALQLAIPIAILARQIQGDLFAAERLGRLALHHSGKPITAAELQDMIGDALDDPTLTLAVWSEEHANYLDVKGRVLEPPRRSDGRAVTTVSSDDGEPTAVLVHEPSLDTDSDVVQGLAATSVMLLRNANLVAELRASRARLVDTAERERQRLERHLHDGAQQQLVAALINLSLAADLADGQPELNERIRKSSAEIEGALAELRTLAHGIYPRALTDLGLARALAFLAVRFPGKVSIIEATSGRFSPEVEHAIYYCCLEAVQNAVKYAGPRAHVSICLYTVADQLCLEVRDDGRGFNVVAAHNGAGLQNMRDRLGAVGGRAEIASMPGHGTTVTAWAPAL